MVYRAIVNVLKPEVFPYAVAPNMANTHMIPAHDRRSRFFDIRWTRVCEKTSEQTKRSLDLSSELSVTSLPKTTTKTLQTGTMEVDRAVMILRALPRRAKIRTTRNARRSRRVLMTRMSKNGRSEIVVMTTTTKSKMLKALLLRTYAWKRAGT
jgi:hypothetical protein